MNIVKINSAVRVASMKTPWTKEVCADKVVRTLNEAGKRILTIYEENIAPAI